LAGVPVRRSGKLYRRDGRPLTVVRRHWKDYPAPTPQPTPCRIWQGAIDKDGYGVLSIRPGDGSRRKVYAHRWVYEAVHGPLPKGMVVRHKCDNRPCFRLTHLEAGTVADNNRDAQERGHLGASFKLAPSQVVELFDLLDGGMSMRAIARHFGISDFAVRSYVKRGRDGFPHIWGEREYAPKKQKPLKHSDWRNR
jgi:DNA-binding CsgD family transcriptional regulator